MRNDFDAGKSITRAIVRALNIESFFGPEIASSRQASGISGALRYIKIIICLLVGLTVRRGTRRPWSISARTWDRQQPEKHGQPGYMDNRATWTTWQYGQPGYMDNLATGTTWLHGQPGNGDNLETGTTWKQGQSGNRDNWATWTTWLHRQPGSMTAWLNGQPGSLDNLAT